MAQAQIDIESMAPFFWDVDIHALDPQRHKKFIIERLLKFGTPKEVCWVLETYSSGDLIDVIKNSRSLDRKTANFWAIHFGIPKQEVRCLNMPLTQGCFY